MADGITQGFACAVGLKNIKKENEALQFIQSSGASLIKVEFGKNFGRPKQTWEFKDKSRISFFPTTALFLFDYRYILPTT